MGGRIVSLDAKTADLFVTTEGLMFVSDWNAACMCANTRGDPTGPLSSRTRDGDGRSRRDRTHKSSFPRPLVPAKAGRESSVFCTNATGSPPPIKTFEGRLFAGTTGLSCNSELRHISGAIHAD